MNEEHRAPDILEASLGGDDTARERLVHLIYDDLRELAARQLGRERADHTLQPTALVHEAFLRLVGQDRADFQGKTHFFALAATSVRRVLIDHARANKARKRGGGEARQPVTESIVGGQGDPAQLVDLHDALSRLAGKEPRQARVVELRFFGGLTLDEVATQIGVSRDTVKLDWRSARAWLSKELGDATAC